MTFGNRVVDIVPVVDAPSPVALSDVGRTDRAIASLRYAAKKNGFRPSRADEPRA